MARSRFGRGAALFGAVTSLALTAGLTAGAAHAGAPSVTGQKYSDATGALSDAGFQPVVSTTVGDQKSWSDCLVANQQSRDVQPPENSSGSVVHEVLLSLNCYSVEASAKGAGYSAASPEGRAAAAEAAKEKADQQAAAAAAAKQTAAKQKSS